MADDAKVPFARPCTGCGRTNVETRPYVCRWPDGRLTSERHCEICRVSWQPQLRALGAKIEVVE